MAFLKALYLDKRELVATHWKQIGLGFAVIMVLASIPVWRESVEERFLLEPAQRSVVRASVPGMVMEVSADEGERVIAGQPIAILRDLQLETDAAKAKADYGQASARSVQGQLRYASYSSAEQERQRLAESIKQISERQQCLSLKSPIAGAVMTPHVHDLVGSYITAGTVVAEVADTSFMRAKIYVQEDEFQKIQQINKAVLRTDANWAPIRASFTSFSPVSQELAPGLMPPAKYKGMHPPVYYVMEMRVDNERGQLRTGMTGTARVYGERRSTAAKVFRPVIEAVARRLW